jgi:hypothetical protein
VRRTRRSHRTKTEGSSKVLPCGGLFRVSRKANIHAKFILAAKEGGYNEIDWMRDGFVRSFRDILAFNIDRCFAGCDITEGKG